MKTLKINQNNKPFNCDNCQHNRFVEHTDHSNALNFACTKCHELHEADHLNLRKAPDSHLHLQGYCSHLGEK